MTKLRWILLAVAVCAAATIVCMLLLPDREQHRRRSAPPRGQWHRLRGAAPTLTPKQKREMARLESLSYLGGYKPVPARTGVTRHHREAAHQGLNLVFSGHGPEATLMNMDGKVLHTWRCTYAQAEQKNPALRGRVGGGRWSWRRGHLLADGGLLAIFEGLGLIRLDRHSRLLWAHARGFHHALYVSPDGTIHALTRRARLIPRINPKRPVLVDYITRLSPDGTTRGEIALLEAFEDSPHAALLKRVGNGEATDGDLFHTNSIQVLDGRHAAAHPAFRRGNLLISVLHLNAIAIVDPERRRVVWAASGDWRRQHEPLLLPSGNILLFDNVGAAGASRVIELAPLTLKTVWEYRGSEDEPFASEECGTAYRLPGGNTLITESLNGRAFEVTPDKRIVWEYYNPHRAGEHNELIATLFDVQRLPRDFPLGWLQREKGSAGK